MNEQVTFYLRGPLALSSPNEWRKPRRVLRLPRIGAPVRWHSDERGGGKKSGSNDG